MNACRLSSIARGTFVADRLVACAARASDREMLDWRRVAERWTAATTAIAVAVVVSAVMTASAVAVRARLRRAVRCAARM